MKSSGETCIENIVAGSREMTIATAAKVMRNQHADAIVVVDNTHAPSAAGLVTDRDLVVHVIALGLDLKAITVGDMGELLENGGSRELVQMMDRLRATGVRQLAVMDAKGRPAGLVAIDDLVGSAFPQSKAGPVWSRDATLKAMERLQAREREFNLKLVFTLVEGNYVSDVVKNKAGNPVLVLHAPGPLVLAKLPRGAYVVEATYEGRTQTRKIDVRERMRTEYLRWPSNPETDFPGPKATERE